MGQDQGHLQQNLTSHALREFALERLRTSAEKLRSAGVLHAAIFGSVARGDAEPDSDVDILVDLDPNARVGLFKFVGLQQMLESIMEREVDLVSRKGLRPGRGTSILQDAIEAF